jgi:1-aminocyclopropane-1-carboxylate deaminase/D-cysteine desulfhydrase-like pyridoxal-dependent ACC family enzyme
MVNKVYVNSDGLLEIWVVGDQTAESVGEMGEKLVYYVQLLRGQHRPVLILDNLIQMGATTSEARREVARIAKTLDYDRAAMVGDGSAFMRHGTNLMLRAIGRSNVRYFGNLETATKWLRTGAEALGKRS